MATRESTTTDGEDEQPALQESKAKLLIDSLLDEFRYRHELFWKIIFRFSSAILILYTIPFLKIDYVRSIEELTFAFPLVGLGLSVMGAVLLCLEYKILSFVEANYNTCKDSIHAGFSNIHKLKHRHIGRLIIATWFLFFGGLGIAESFYLSSEHNQKPSQSKWEYRLTLSLETESS